MRVYWSIAAAAALICLSTPFVSGECPNGCSGNGDCMSKDMCQCYKNYQGNDCADRTCLFGYAHVDTPRGDINMDQDRKTASWILANSQQSPEQTYEYFNPSAKASEAHFYLECSNKGICDRSTGLCQCFDGYEGNGCRRTACPGKCSGHGTCESIRELGLKAGGTLFGGEGAAGPVLYDLWDSNSTYGCRCDPWFFGPDCSKRTCKVGVDPLFLSAGTPTLETFVIHAYHTTAATALPADSWVRLRLFDYYGESYITAPITVLDDSVAGNPAKNAAAVAAAIKAVPNLTFKEVKCEGTGVGTSLAGYLSVRPTASVKGMSVTCQYVENPGKMRLPEIASFDYPTIADADSKAVVVTTAQQGADEEWFTVKTAFTVTSVSVDGLTLTVAGGDPAALVVAPGQLIKIGQHVVMAASTTATTIVLTYPLLHTLPSNAPVFRADATTGATAFLLTAGTALAAAIDVGSDLMTFTATVPNYVVGETIFYHNAFYTVQSVYLDTVYYVKLDKPFGGNAADGTAGATASVPYRLTMATDKTKTYTYVSECSGRGLCGYDSGVCTCFKGYTNDNCNTQNILAL